MSWTKGALIKQAYVELATAGFEFDLSPEEEQNALIELDTMMATWGVDVGYVFGLTPDETDIDEDSGLPLVAVAAVYKKLAIGLAGGKGRVVPNSLKTSAKAAFDALVLWVVQQEMTPQRSVCMPRGAGNRTRWLTVPIDGEE